MQLLLEEASKTVVSLHRPSKRTALMKHGNVYARILGKGEDMVAIENCIQCEEDDHADIAKSQANEQGDGWDREQSGSGWDLKEGLTLEPQSDIDVKYSRTIECNEARPAKNQARGKQRDL